MSLARRKSSLTSPPTLTSSTLGSDGKALTLTFSRNITIGAGGSSGITTNWTTAGSRSASYVSNSGNTVTYNLDKHINSTDTGTVSYTQPGNGIEASNNAQDVASFSNRSITNNSTVSVHLNSATINGTTLALTWLENKSTGAGWSGSDITLTINGTENLGVTLDSGSGTSSWSFTYGSGVTSGDTVKVSFNGAINSVEDSLGADTPPFTNFSVTNNTP